MQDATQVLSARRSKLLEQEEQTPSGDEQVLQFGPQAVHVLSDARYCFSLQDATQVLSARSSKLLEQEEQTPSGDEQVLQFGPQSLHVLSDARY